MGYFFRLVDLYILIVLNKCAGGELSYQVPFGVAKFSIAEKFVDKQERLVF